MSAQHTPGPWEYGTKDDGWDMSSLGTVYNVPTLATEDGKGRTYADISARVKCFEVDAAQREANGRLMAAAPDLLEALQGVLRVADRKTKEFDCARAAIAKAEGRS